MKPLRAIALFILFAFCISLLPLYPATATTISVSSSNDVNDGTCNLIHCSLRDAILAGEANPGSNEIRFKITGCGGACSITLSSPLPTLASGDTSIEGAG